MRKRWIVTSAIGICLAVVAFAFWALADVNRFRSQVEASLRSKFGRDVHLGEMKLSVLPLGFRVDHVVISEDPVFGTDHSFAAIKTLYVQPRVLPLLHGVVEVQSLQLSQPSLELIRNDKGDWNFTSLLEGRPLSLAKLKIDDGEVAITDRFERAARAVYDHIDLSIYDYVPEGSFPIEASAHLPGPGAQLIAFSGRAGPINRASLDRTPLDGKLELDEVALSGLQRFLKTEALTNSDAVLTGSGEIKNNGIVASKGQMSAHDVRIRGVKLDYPIVADYDISSDTVEKTIAIRKMDLKLANTPVSIAGSINSATTPALLDVQLRADGSIAEIARLGAAFGVVFDGTSDVSGRVNFDVRAKGPSDKPVLEGNALAREIRITTGEGREPVLVSAADVSFSPNEIRSNSFTASTGKTRVTAQVSISDYSTDNPQLAARLDTGNAEVGELVRVARAYGFAGEDGLSGSGAITLNVGVNGPLKQSGKWTYSGSGIVNQATLRLPSLGAKPLNVRKANLLFTANSMVIEELNFSIGETTASGRLTAYNLAAPRVEFSLTADKINAAEWHEMAKLRPVNTPKPEGRGEIRSSLLARATGSGQLAAQSVVYDQLVLSNVRSAVKLDEGVITMSPITAGLYNGQEVGTVVVNVRVQPVSYEVKSKLRGIDANQFLSSVSSLKSMLFGVMSASTDGRFSATGSAGDIARSLNGNVMLNLDDGRLANMDLLHQLAIIGKFGRTARAVEPFTRLIRMNGDFAITNGVARTRNLEAVFEDGSFAADGTIDLVDQKLNLQLTAVLSEEYSQTVGGAGIGGLMSTVLPNRKGEFVVPILLTGTFKSPQFAPDLAKIARMKLENLVPTLINPDKLSTGILGEIFPGKSAPGEPPPERGRAESPLRDILEGLFGGRK